MFTVIIPAHDEAAYIGRTLDALRAQDTNAPGAVHVIVAANGCRDKTAEIARSRIEVFTERGWHLSVVEIPEGRKTAAINAAEAIAQPGPRIFLDADVVCNPALLGQLMQALAPAQPLHATGRFQIKPPESAVSRAYARTWMRVPFMSAGTPSAGLFAVNAAGRARWGIFPDIIADDIFVRLQFAPRERVAVPAPYSWILAEGFGPLVRVRRRWDAGNRQLAVRYPELFRNEDTPPVRMKDHLQLFLAGPAGYLVYVAVSIAAHARRYDPDHWARGRG
ncbi:glycosyltransferase [Aliiruegeria haliotis]|uniref:glycosyltransferase n=1 Tax=Aliiruegeria haliotis TaxID=1280846 RepID=UPI000D081566|nr:glycosyltransferase [Aliiruegeria haliotis]